MVPLVGSGFFTVSIITLFMPILTYLCMSYPQYAASVMAGNPLFRASCGVVFPLFVSIDGIKRVSFQIAKIYIRTSSFS
ncbi:MAG: hypothetical protein CL912_02170 [Deltaproteobacteria bacterium]|nr:hypothetical protein [Deltaproteobacteria bacterium]